MCYTLTGYQVDITTENQYRLTSMYAEHKTDCLIFKVGCTAHSRAHRTSTVPPTGSRPPRAWHRSPDPHRKRPPPGPSWPSSSALAPSLGGSRAGAPASAVPARGLSNGVKVRIGPGRCPRRCQACSWTAADRPREKSCQTCAAPAAEGHQAGGSPGELAGAERMGLEPLHLLAGTLSRSLVSLLAGPRGH